jgi:NADPH:quinone reductase-like Zn-dependent oxidoreductase
MRAVAIPAPGGPEVLTVVDRDVRAARPGEVRVTVRAAAVNPTDIGLREHGGGESLEPPRVPGMDAAGVVESVGVGVDRVAPGDRGIDVRPVWVRTVLDRTDWLEHLRERAGDGRLQLRVAGEYAPEQAAEAHRRMEAGGPRGRAVIVF